MFLFIVSAKWRCYNHDGLNNMDTRGTEPARFNHIYYVHNVTKIFLKKYKEDDHVGLLIYGFLNVYDVYVCTLVHLTIMWPKIDTHTYIVTTNIYIGACFSSAPPLPVATHVFYIFYYFQWQVCCATIIR